MSLYATLADVLAVQLAKNAVTAQDEAAFLTALRVVSRRIDREMSSPAPIFAPVTETRRFRLYGYEVNRYDGTLALPWPLLALTGVTRSGGSPLTVGTQVEGWPAGPPYRMLRLVQDCELWWAWCTDRRGPPTVEVTGVWGLHSDYANAWARVDAVTATAVTTTTQTTVTVGDVDGPDEYGLPNRLSAGALIRINSEVMEVVSTDAFANTLTVLRGRLGTVAATHALTDAVFVWRPDTPVRYVTARQAALLVNRRGGYNSKQVKGSGPEYPDDLLPELRNTLGGYRYGV